MNICNEIKTKSIKIYVLLFVGTRSLHLKPNFIYFISFFAACSEWPFFSSTNYVSFQFFSLNQAFIVTYYYCIFFVGVESTWNMHAATNLPFRHAYTASTRIYLYVCTDFSFLLFLPIFSHLLRITIASGSKTITQFRCDF